MQLPTIHLNGTAKVSLIESLCDARSAIHTAFQALRETCPNGRDFVNRNDSFREAIREHNDRLNRLDAIQCEVSQLAMAISELE